MNNTPIVVLLMPIIVGASLRSKFPVSGVMMPMGLATIIGGMSTTIGTSTNLLVVGISRDMGMHEFSMFEWVLPVAIVGGVGLLFLWLVSPRLLPDRTPPMADTTPRIFSAQLHVKEGGFADGKSLSDVLAKADGNLRIDKIQRSESLFLAKLPSVIIQPGDRLFVKDSPENLKHYEQLLGTTLFNLSRTTSTRSMKTRRSKPKGNSSQKLWSRVVRPCTCAVWRPLVSRVVMACCHSHCTGHGRQARR